MAYGFEDNKYTNCYFRLINKAKIRSANLPQYFELHHIIPSSLGGGNENGNLIKLSYREHFICHLLLTKMTKGKDRSKMIFAFYRFSNTKEKYTTSRSYERLKKATYKELCGENNHFFGKKHSQQTKELISKNHGMRGTSLYQIWEKKYSKEEAVIRYDQMNKKRAESLTGDKHPAWGKSRSKETIEKHRAKLLGRKRIGMAWFTKNGSDKFTFITNKAKLLEDGWKKGRAKGHRKPSTNN